MVILLFYVQQVLQTASKVGHWLSKQHDLGEYDQPLKLLNTWILSHVNAGEKILNHTNRFSISESGTIGISCLEEPSLSVMYPDADKPPVVLSYDAIFWSATFLNISGKEYLAASCDGDGCLYLWDIELETSRKVFDPLLSSEQRFKWMNIFKIDENTIGYGEVFRSPDRSRRVFILSTKRKELTLTSTLRVFAPKNIHDICYTEVDGGTPCLLLCVPNDNRIMAVEMVGGRTRWEAGKQQMGENFYPWSICSDDNNIVYVTDYWENRIHLLSADDGSVIRSIDVHDYGMKNLVAVRFHDQHLYVEHYTNPGLKYAISKFRKEI